MRLVATLLLLFFLHLAAAAQTWHSASKWLNEPKSPSGIYATVSLFSRYDSVPCTYVSASSKLLQKGYKVVYVKNGYYTDDPATFGVFLDENWRRIRHVSRYYFN